jgi:starvation-inducible DNA-binding protein
VHCAFGDSICAGTRDIPPKARGAFGFYHHAQTNKEFHMTMHITRNDLNSNTVKTCVDLLNARLADAIDLSLIAKQAHWNVKGPHFIAIHEMLDGLRAKLDNHVDTIAERAVQLGGTARGTSQAVVEKTDLKPYPTGISKTRDHLAALIESYAVAARNARQAIADAEEAGDAGTADIFTSYSLMLDKSLWLLESHTQAAD